MREKYFNPQLIWKVHCSLGRNNHTPTLDILTSVGNKKQEKKRIILSAAFTDIILLSQSSHSPHETHLSQAGKFIPWFFVRLILVLTRINLTKLKLKLGYQNCVRHNNLQFCLEFSIDQSLAGTFWERMPLLLKYCFIDIEASFHQIHHRSRHPKEPPGNFNLFS